MLITTCIQCKLDDLITLWLFQDGLNQLLQQNHFLICRCNGRAAAFVPLPPFRCLTLLPYSGGLVCPTKLFGRITGDKCNAHV